MILVRAFTLLCLAFVVLTGCSQTPGQAPTTVPPVSQALYVFRLEPPVLLELSGDRTILREIPVTIPGGCSLGSIFGPPAGATLAIELSCSFGQAVVWLDSASGKMTQPVTDSDSHFLAWAPDGQSAYLKVDTMGRPRIVNAPINGTLGVVTISALTYDLAPKPGGGSEFLYSVSLGMGHGSEIWAARGWGAFAERLMADSHNYISFARWSPDLSKIAFIKIPDSATPFTVGELWVMQADGSGARKLANADAGHGFAEAWSPDGDRIAFVVRENPQDAQADQSAGALKSNISIVNLSDGAESQLTHFEGASVEAPVWSPDGRQIALTAVLDDKMNAYLADLASGQVQPLLSVPACCPVWMRK